MSQHLQRVIFCFIILILFYFLFSFQCIIINNNKKKFSKLRLEFECSNQEYYTELDAVEVVGVLYDLPNVNEFSHKLKHLANAFCEANLIKPFLNKLESPPTQQQQQQQQEEEQQEEEKQEEQNETKEVVDNLSRLKM